MRPAPFASFGALAAGNGGLGAAHLRAINGQDADRGQFPHQVGLYVDMATFCGGALISPKWILTAGTCTGKEPYGSRYTAFLGALNINLPAEKGRIAVTTTWAYIHDQFDAETYQNDVALILLPRAVKTTDSIKPLNLPPQSYASKDFDGVGFQLSGWGYRSDDAAAIAPVLQVIQLQGVSKKVCVNTYSYEVYTDNILCCQGANKQSPCQGDTGGALVQQESDGSYTHIAVASFTPGKGCSTGLPAGFTKTASYLDWISSKTGLPTKP